MTYRKEFLPKEVSTLLSAQFNSDKRGYYTDAEYKRITKILKQFDPQSQSIQDILRQMEIILV